MEAILSKQIWLYPIDRRLIIVITRSKKFSPRPRFGFYEKNNKTYFLAGFGKTLMGMRIVSNNDAE